MHTDTTQMERKDFVGMLPCGLVTPFREAVLRFVNSHPDLQEACSIDLEGNVNHEKSYYPLLEQATTPQELPDILVASDINNLFHLPFRKRFLESEVFAEYLPQGRNADLQRLGYFDPEHRFTMLTSNLLVIVADKTRLEGREAPRSWKDLLSPQFRQSIAIRGDQDFFCNGVLLPFFRWYGLEAITQLAENVTGGMHPAAMAKQAGSGAPDSPAILVMPWFFAGNIVRKEAVEIIWPEEGPIPSPVFLLAKRNLAMPQQQILDFLVSQELGEVVSRRGFPSTHPAVQFGTPLHSLFWVGWDFLTREDVGAAKNKIQDCFRSALHKRQA